MSQQPPVVQVNISIDELRVLIREAVHDALLEMLGEDMNSEPNFAPEIAERLQRYKTEKPAHVSIDEAVKELGVDD